MDDNRGNPGGMQGVLSVIVLNGPAHDISVGNHVVVDTGIYEVVTIERRELGGGAVNAVLGLAQPTTSDLNNLVFLT